MQPYLPLATIVAALNLFPALAAQVEPPAVPPPSLKTVKVPRVPGLERLVRDRDLAIVLGKALFWDQQAGSDGMACASCHFHAGADSRFVNQLSPSLLHRNPALAGVFDPTATGTGGPNYQLRSGDFPFHVLQDPNDRESAVLFDTNDVTSSAGVFRAAFTSVGDPSAMFDPCNPVADGLFHIGGLNTRRVEPRNTPTVINAAFNFRNFWDGRANNQFNGVNPFGPRDGHARILHWNPSNGMLTTRTIRLRNSSLASQAVGPPLSDSEMSCTGRTFPDVGRKMVPRRALAFQGIAADDSVLAGHIDSSGIGLIHTYEALIQQAFHSEWWAAPNNQLTNGYTQIERNFSMFWGIAIQLYEATLISDDAPYDRFAEGDPNALSAAQRRGLDVFMGAGGCINCHKGPDFTGAGFVLQAAHEEGGIIERMLMGAGHAAQYDNGFYNIGVRPSNEDVGVGGRDPFGNPLSFTRQWLAFLNTGRALRDSFFVDPTTFEVGVLLPPDPTRADLRLAFGSDADAVDGSFKTPGLRNVELTGPYFHNGGQATLEQVVAFYNRGGDRRSSGTGDTSGFGRNASNLDPDITQLNLTAQQQGDLVEFLKSLTDERVRWEQAPFDHPQLAVPHGHLEQPHQQLGPQIAEDAGTIVPAIGRDGRAPLNLPALQPFHTQLQ